MVNQNKYIVCNERSNKIDRILRNLRSVKIKVLTRTHLNRADISV